MKINLKDLSQKNHQTRIIQPILALTLAIIPTLNFGYTAPADQRPPYDRGGRSGNLYPMESISVIPLPY